MPERESQRQVSTPTFYASSVSVVGTGTDVKVGFADVKPEFEITGEAKGKPPIFQVALIAMSVHAAKDLSKLLEAHIAQFEKEFGEIKTPFLNRINRQ